MSLGTFRFFILKLQQMKDLSNHSHCETDLRKSGKPTGGVSSPPAYPPPPPPPPPFSAVEEGGIGDLLLDNKPTFKEGHTNYVTLRVENITEVAGYAPRYSVGDNGSIMPSPRARSPRRDLSFVTQFVIKSSFH